jgi:hypothetical protein
MSSPKLPKTDLHGPVTRTTCYSARAEVRTPIRAVFTCRDSPAFRARVRVWVCSISVESGISGRGHRDGDGRERTAGIPRRDEPRCQSSPSRSANDADRCPWPPGIGPVARH